MQNSRDLPGSVGNPGQFCDPGITGDLARWD